MATKAAYWRRVEQLRKQAAKELGYESPSSVPSLSVVEHLLARKGASVELAAEQGKRSPDGKHLVALKRDAITRATWRQYRASLLFVLKEERDRTREGVVAEELGHAIRVLMDETQTGCLKTSARTSGNKAKRFPAADFAAITGYLQANVARQGNEKPHKLANTLLTWLKASQLVGLRPSEWNSAGLETVDGKPALRVGNAKATNGRANGEVRFLLLDRASEDDIAALHEMLGMLVNYGQEISFEKLLSRLGRYMNYVTRRVLGKRKKYPTLYSPRHQLVANAKADGATREEIAALMGHGADHTAGRHYARGVSASGPLKVTPSPADVATVRQTGRASFKYRPQRGA